MRPRFRPLAGLVALAVAVPVVAQTPTPTGMAVPPDRATLDRLSLRSEWAINLPVDGRRDAVLRVQTFGDQLFVQTHAGALTAVEAATGRIQWTALLGNGQSTNTPPLAVNSRFVFAANVTTLYAFHRYSGMLEFSFDMGTLPQAGLAADEDTVYAVLAIRPGYAGAHRIEAYGLPRPVPLAAQVADPARVGGGGPAAGSRQAGLINPIDAQLRRYPVAAAARVAAPEATPTRRIDAARGVPAGGYTGSRTPSLVTVPTVLPPYRLDTGAAIASLDMVTSFRQPIGRPPEGERVIQRSASLTSIPPSIAAALSLSDLRPKGIRPTTRWELGTERGLVAAPLLTPTRLWGATDDAKLIAVSKVDKAPLVASNVPARVAADAGQAGETGYFPLSNGVMMAVDLAGGNLDGGAAVLWRAAVGGPLNHPPLVTGDAVFATGDNAGVARIDRASGDVVWQAEPTADRVLAVNDEFAYLRDRRGRLLVYDAKRPSDPGFRSSRPLTAVDLPGFDVPVTNTATDRLYLVSGSGLIVCLREAADKYVRPVRVAPEIRTEAPVVKKDPMAAPPTPPADEPKKEPEPKKE